VKNSSRTFSRYGGIDVGGTKIEATLFDEHLSVVSTHRIATPSNNYESFLSVLAAEAQNLRESSTSGVCMTANLPATGQRLRDDLHALLGGNIAIDSDCNCLALSEANDGAGAGYSRVFGLILGTGIGGGLCVESKLMSGSQGILGEVGHIALPAHLVAQLDIGKPLPILSCGCGRTGCYETLASGKGLSQLCMSLIDKSFSPADIAAFAASGDANCEMVYGVWLEIVAELLNTIQLCMDPDCIVLGGGLSNIPNLADSLSQALTKVALPRVRQPDINIARFGDSSGGRGAALLAIQQHQMASLETGEK